MIFGQPYKGMQRATVPDAWSYFYPESRRLACLIQQTKRMMNSWCASLPMEWVHYRRTIMKYHEPSPSARIAKAHGSEDVGSLPVFFGFFWIGWFDQTPQSQNFILKKDALNWWLWNRPCVPCCRYGDLSSWERIIQKQAEVSKNRKNVTHSIEQKHVKIIYLGHCFHADWQVECQHLIAVILMCGSPNTIPLMSVCSDDHMGTWVDLQDVKAKCLVNDLCRTFNCSMGLLPLDKTKAHPSM